jgi:hypothetical protein
MKSSTSTPRTSTLRRSFSPSLAREIRLGRVKALPALSQRVAQPIPTDEEVFGVHASCPGCGENTPVFFLGQGICPDCVSIARREEAAVGGCWS